MLNSLCFAEIYGKIHDWAVLATNGSSYVRAEFCEFQKSLMRETGGHEHSSEFHTILFFTPSGLIQADIPHLSLPVFHCNYGESESVIVW